MNVVVCIKQVPDSESIIRIKEDGSGIITENLKYVMNPFDEFAVEEAVKIKEELGKGTVTIICIGPRRAEKTIRTGLAMGVDNAIHLDDPAFEEGDAFATAMVLSEVIRNMPFDIILTGRQAMDDDQAQVGSVLAELLGIPQVSLAVKIEILGDRKKARVRRQIEGGEEVIECLLPAVFTCQKDLNEPRYPSFTSIMKAKKKTIETKDLTSLGLNSRETGKAVSKTKIIKLSLPPERLSGKIIEGEGPAEKVSKLVKILRQEAKLI